MSILYMISLLRVYVYPETLIFFNNNRDITDKLIIDYHVCITTINRKHECYIEVEGLFEDIHKVRIILQDLERENYRDIFLKI